MWSHPAAPLHLRWKTLSPNRFSCQTPFRRLSHHRSSSASSLSARPFRTPRGKSPVWISPIKGPRNLNPLPAAGPGTRSDGKHRINSVRGEKNCVSDHFCLFWLPAVHRELWLRPRAAGFPSLSSSGTRPCATATPSASPPLQNYTYAASTPSPSGTQKPLRRY